ncbi:hypothetical protein [Micavibrio aeruginosavorus]|uniref:hypothetical protein n=1 Tax=Micavibrio aeruginosavorus TaxID=349221 RepID=UPI003F4AD93C
MILLSHAIMKEECDRNDVNCDLVLSHRRGEVLDGVRHVIITRMHRELSMGPAEIGRAMNRDHSAICYHLKKFKNTSPSVNPSPKGGLDEVGGGRTRHSDRTDPAAATLYGEAR